MLPSIANIALGNRFVGVELFTVDNQEYAEFLLMQRKRNELTINLNLRSTSLDVPQGFNKDLPFFLVVNNRQIIQKEVDGVDNNLEKLVYRAFPNLSLNDFYYEVFRLKSKSVVAIARKDYIDGLLSSFHKQNITVAAIGLGICPIAEILPYYNGDVIETSSQKIDLNESQQVLSVNDNFLSARTYDLNGIVVSNNHLLCLSGILRLLKANGVSLGNISDINIHVRNKFNQKRLFSKGIRAMVAFLLIILLANFFAFNFYYGKVAQAEELISINQYTIDQIQAARVRIKTKETRLTDLVDQTATKSSVIINEITSVLPNSIVLNELIYHPLEKKISDDELIPVVEKVIQISGITINNNAFTSWIEHLERNPKVADVAIVNFGKDEDNNTFFEIKITQK